MLHLDTLVLHNFKSFRHASIKFTDGFNCIVGSNGSGKSSICDSLLFALGEGSLKRMHVPSFSYLINASAKPKPEDGSRRAYVKLTLSSGDEQYEIMRTIKESKVGYRLNGRHVTRQEVLDLLYHEQSEINDTNVITQGEIVSKTDLNAKERRELIDVAAGIKEFDDKKAAAMRELEKVGAKINEARVMLSERLGFLEELKKEKDDAERYLELASLLKRANFTILNHKGHELSQEYERLLKNVEDKKAQASRAETDIRKLDIEIEKASTEKQSLLNALNARSSETNEESRALEEISKSVAVLEASIKTCEARISELADKQKALSNERANLEAEFSSNRLSIESIAKDLEANERELSKLEPQGRASGSYNISIYESNQKRLYAISSKKEQLIADRTASEAARSKGEAQSSGAEKELSDALSVVAETKTRLENASDMTHATNNKISVLSEQIEVLKSRTASIRAHIDDNYRQRVDIREKLAMLGSSTSRTGSVLKSEVKGFNGTVEELCTYEGKYAIAIQAAAASRMGYFVIDTISDASRAIEILKSKNLGRATFIPVKELIVKGETEHVDGATPLLSIVSFDKKYDKIFRYVFSNAYLVGNVNAAKAIGIGKYRFVTMEGEVIEPAGIISGGSMKESTAQLTAKLKVLESEKDALEKQQGELDSAFESASKDMAGRQVELLSISSSVKSMQSTIDATMAKAHNLEILIEEGKSSASVAAKKLESVAAELSNIERDISKLRDENDQLYTAMASRQGQGPKPSRSKALRDAVESLRIKIATKSKENELTEERIKSLSSEASSLEVESKKQKQEKQNAAQKISKLSTDSKELQEKIKSHDEKSAGIYKQITEIDASISQAAQERGRLSGDLERQRRDLIGIEAAKVQTETRLNDIKAELVSYSNVQELDKSASELEKQIILWKADMEKLGAVNMKAPEIYEQKSRDVNEARQKVSILGSEKDSIISMMNEIDSKKLSIFMDTFNTVNENFKKLYSYAFTDSGYLELEDSKDSFNSGLLIKVKGSNNKEKVQIAPSGGEKSLHMLMLIFAIQMCKPMSLYIFDEIDVALDKENTKKLSRIIKELSRKSQMVIVSHNDNMIVAADTAIGVAMGGGESRVFGIEVSALKAEEQQAQKNSS